MMMHFSKILGVLALLLLAVGAAAGDVTVAKKTAHELVRQAANGDTAALEKLKAGAEKGDAVYEERYGYYLSDVPQVCDHNNSVKQCSSEARKRVDQGILWYKKAAEQGYAPAQVDLGQAYMNPSGANLNNQQAFLWYKKAADQGYAPAQVALGDIYNGASHPDSIITGDSSGCDDDGNGCLGVKIDHTKAFMLYKKAADQWNTDALQRLGDDYSGADGGVVHRIRIAAYAFYESATDIDDDIGSVDWQHPFTKAQIKTAKALEQRMSKIGVSAAIDEYLKSIHKTK